MIAHQKLIRDKRALEDSDADMFGRWWQGINLNLARADVREVSFDTAKSIIEKYEWLGTMPAIVRHCYGIFFDGCCGGVVVYGDEYAENLGVWDKYGFTGKIICLSRGACTHWSPVGTASRLIRRSMDLLPQRYEVITCTCDESAGEIGTIYQACGFDYVGVWSRGKAGVAHVTVDGKRVSERAAKERYGTRGVDALRGMGLDSTTSKRKARYFGFRGPVAVIKKNRGKIRARIEPYPKRAEKVSSRDTAGTTGRAGGSSPSPLQNRPK